MKEVRKRSIASLLYDSLGWTPLEKITSQGIQTIRQGIKLLYKEVITSDEFMKLKKELLSTGMATMPHDYPPTINTIKPGSMVWIKFADQIGVVACPDTDSSLYKYDWIVRLGDGKDFPCWEKELLLLPTNE